MNGVCACHGTFEEDYHFFGTGDLREAWKCNNCGAIMTSDYKYFRGNKKKFEEGMKNEIPK